MNKQRYLAELRRLLVFMTDEDREAAVRRYGELFDAAGPEGEAALLDEIGSPTKAAIGLSRGYVPGRVEKILPEGAEFPPASGEGEAVPPAPGPAKREPVPPAPPLEPAPAGSRAVVERSVPLGLGVPLFILVFAALGIPLAALFLALTAVLLLPGCAVLAGAYLVAVGGLWSLSYLADAILLFGAAFLVLALGLVVLWAGLWVASRLWKAWFGFIRWLSGELLGRKVTVNE